MINHARTLLLNLARDTSPVPDAYEEYIDPAYGPVSKTFVITGLVMPTGLTRHEKNLRVFNMLNMVHRPDYMYYVKRFDSRIVYDINRAGLMYSLADGTERVRVDAVTLYTQLHSLIYKDTNLALLFDTPDFYPEDMAALKSLWMNGETPADRNAGALLALVYRIERERGLAGAAERRNLRLNGLAAPAASLSSWTALPVPWGCCWPDGRCTNVEWSGISYPYEMHDKFRRECTDLGGTSYPGDGAHTQCPGDGRCAPPAKFCQFVFGTDWDCTTSTWGPVGIVGPATECAVACTATDWIYSYLGQGECNYSKTICVPDACYEYRDCQLNPPPTPAGPSWTVTPPGCDCTMGDCRFRFAGRYDVGLQSWVSILPTGYMNCHEYGACEETEWVYDSSEGDVCVYLKDVCVREVCYYTLGCNDHVPAPPAPPVVLPPGCGVVPPPAGQCCLPLGFCAELTSEACVASSGSWAGAGTVCSSGACFDHTPCEYYGSMCKDNGSVFINGGWLTPERAVFEALDGCYRFGPTIGPTFCGCVLQSDSPMLEPGGTWRGHGRQCAVQQGACCDPLGTCSELTEESCATTGGTYMGDNIYCENIECAQPSGACCDPASFDCVILTEASCAALGLVYQGNDTSCTPENPCIPPLVLYGTCCKTDGTCEVNTQLVCTQIPGAVWTGSINPQCGPINPCPQPNWFCNSYGICDYDSTYHEGGYTTLALCEATLLSGWSYDPNTDLCTEHTWCAGDAPPYATCAACVSSTGADPSSCPQPVMDILTTSYDYKRISDGGGIYPYIQPRFNSDNTKLIVNKSPTIDFKVFSVANNDISTMTLDVGNTLTLLPPAGWDPADHWGAPYWFGTGPTLNHVFFGAYWDDWDEVKPAYLEQYNLATAANLTTATRVLDSQRSPIGTYTQFIKMSSDGTKIWLSNPSGSTIAQFSLSTPFDMSTLNNTPVQTKAVGTGTSRFCFNSDNTKLLKLATVTGVVSQHSMTGDDIATIVPDYKQVTVEFYSNAARSDIQLASDNSFMIIQSGNYFQQYRLTGESHWTVNSATLDPLHDNLIGYYDCLNGAIMTDRRRYATANNIYTTGPTSTAAGRNGYGALFGTSTNNRMVIAGAVGGAPWLPNATRKYTMGAWVKPTGNGNIFSGAWDTYTGDGDGYTKVFEVYLSGGVLSAKVGDGSVITGPTLAVDGSTWYYVAFAQDMDDKRYYLWCAGAPVGNTTYTTVPGGIGYEQNYLACAVGKTYDNKSSIQNCCGGTFDEISLWNKVLTDAEVLALAGSAYWLQNRG